MDYVSYGVVIVLLIVGGGFLWLRHFESVIIRVCLDAYESLSFNRMIGESAAERIITKGGVDVERFLASVTFSVFCNKYVQGYELMQLTKPFLRKGQWENYMASNLLLLLEAQGLVRMEVQNLDLSELSTYWTEIEMLPEVLQLRFRIWRCAIENDCEITYGDDEWEDPEPTIQVIVVRKLPNGRKQKDPPSMEHNPQPAY